jgi:hypothetical protein
MSYRPNLRVGYIQRPWCGAVLVVVHHDSIVSHIFNLRMPKQVAHPPDPQCELTLLVFAGCKPGIQQIENLRYGYGYGTVGHHKDLSVN